MNRKSNPLWSDQALQALFTYWEGHMLDFSDSKLREDTGYPNAAKAIKVESGVEVSPTQIHGKIGKLWERHRLRQFKQEGFRFDDVFDIGPSCFDMKRLKILGEQKSANANVQKSKTACQRSVNEKFEQNSTALVEKKRSFDRNLETASSMKPSEQSIGLDALRDRAEKLSRENQRLTIELRNSQSLNEVLKQLSSMELADRGPQDNEVCKAMQDVAYLVQQSCRWYRDEVRPGAIGPSFAEMERCFPKLYTLHQQVFAFTDADETGISTLRLASMGINVVDSGNMLRALVGVAVLHLVFYSSFPPELFCDRGRIASTYERVICEKYGPIARSILNQEVSCSYLQDSSFIDTLETTAKKYAADLGQVLWPLLEQDGLEGAGLPAKDPVSREYWRDKERIFGQIFSKSLNLQASLCLNRDDYTFFWPLPNTPFDASEMKDDKGINKQAHAGMPLTVHVTLFPGLKGLDPEAVPLSEHHNEQVHQSYRVIAQALVLLH